MCRTLKVSVLIGAALAQVHQAQLLRPSRWAGARRDGLVAVKARSLASVGDLLARDAPVKWPCKVFQFADHFQR